MKNLLCSFLLLPFLTIAQTVGVGTNTPDASAMLDITSINKGILIPRMTELQKENILLPATGLLIWQHNGTAGFYYNNGTPAQPKWLMLGVAADTDWKLTGNNNVDSATHFLGSINKAPVFFKVRNTFAGQLDSGCATFFGYMAGMASPHKTNAAFGTEAMSSPSEAGGNTAMGYFAMRENRSGFFLTAVGSEALRDNLNGELNTAVGWHALISNISGNRNTSMGSTTLIHNTTGNDNTAIGHFALRDNTAGSNTAVGAGASQFNAGGQGNVASGYYALNKNVSGSNNTAMGFQALGNTKSSNNTAFGANALALSANVLSVDNIAIGAEAMQNAEATARNTAIGIRALRNCVASNATNGNTAVGYEAATANTSGIDNTTVGTRSMFKNTTGGNSTAIGGFALSNNINGESNTAVGLAALDFNTSGDYNVAVGTQAGKNSVSGDYNTFLGYQAGVNTSHVNATAIGYAAYAECGNCMILGSVSGKNNANVTTKVGVATTNPQYAFQVGIAGDGTQARANAWNSFSDARFKKNIEVIPDALAKLENIHGYYYNWNNGNDQTRQAGLMAQEIEAVLPEIVSTDNDGYKSVDYGKMNALLIQVLKEQQQQIALLQQQVHTLATKQPN